LFGYNPYQLPANPNPFGATGYNNIASRFTVGSSNVTVDFIRYYAGGNGTVTSSISIWSAKAGASTLDSFMPDALVTGATGNFTPTDASTPYSDAFTVNFSSPVTLNANTNYYVVVDTTQVTSTAAAGFVATTAQFGTSSNSFTAFGGTIATPQSRLITQTGTTWASYSSASFLPYTIGMTTVPEPSTYLMGALATGVMAIAARRRRHVNLSK
ncbi:MAG: hypothetical protein RJA81_1623, partial [Planctomycetota bacterium]